jgi:hypothetical protein
MVKRSEVKLLRIETKDQIADVMTKALGKEKFKGFKTLLGVQAGVSKMHFNDLEPGETEAVASRKASLVIKAIKIQVKRQKICRFSLKEPSPDIPSEGAMATYSFTPVVTSKCMSLNNSPPFLSRDGSLNEGRRQAKKSTHVLFWNCE